LNDLIKEQRVRNGPMPKPDKVLRFRPLKEVPEALAELKRVVLFHPKPIVEELKAKFCVCGKGERKSLGGETKGHDSVRRVLGVVSF